VLKATRYLYNMGGASGTACATTVPETVLTDCQTDGWLRQTP